MFIDSHCHLEERTYGDDLPGVLRRAADAGLSHLIAVGATRVAEGAKEAVALAQQHEHIFATAGVHPHDADKAGEEDFVLVESLLSDPKVVALGEVGLDYFYDNSDRDVQRQVFKRFLAMAKRHEIPIMLHVRDAHGDAAACIDEVGLSSRGGVVHCFTAGPDEAQAYLERGFLLSIPGVVTFNNAEPLREAVKMIPADKLLIETDSPYLAPVPYRGKKNEPAYVVETARKVAELRGQDVQAIADLTSQNARLFFAI